MDIKKIIQPYVAPYSPETDNLVIVSPQCNDSDSDDIESSTGPVCPKRILYNLKKNHEDGVVNQNGDNSFWWREKTPYFRVWRKTTEPTQIEI